MTGLKAEAGNPVKLYFPELSVVAYIAGEEKTTVTPEIGAELVLSVTCPVSDMGVVGVGEGDVAVPLPPLHADANVRSRTPQPCLSIGIAHPQLSSLRQCEVPWAPHVRDNQRSGSSLAKVTSLVRFQLAVIKPSIE